MKKKQTNTIVIYYKNCTFAATVHTTLPNRTASQGVSFAFYTFLILLTKKTFIDV